MVVLGKNPPYLINLEGKIMMGNWVLQRLQALLHKVVNDGNGKRVTLQLLASMTLGRDQG